MVTNCLFIYSIIYQILKKIYNTRSEANISTIKINQTFFKNFYFPSAMIEWNKLDIDKRPLPDTQLSLYPLQTCFVCRMDPIWMSIFIHEFLVMLYLTHTSPNISVMLKIGVAITVKEQPQLSLMHFEINDRFIWFRHLLVMSRLNWFIDSRSEITLEMYRNVKWLPGK